MEHEIVIVGAGPCGSVAAAALARRGHDVLLMDRAEFPRDKSCGDNIPAAAVEALYAVGMRERVEAAGFYPVDRFLLYSPAGHTLEADLEPSRRTGARAYVVPRLRFDALVHDYATGCGAAFRTGEVLGPILEEGRVRGVRVRSGGRVGEVRAQVVIGADGAASVIARALQAGRAPDRHVAVALRCYVEGIREDPHAMEFHLDRGILPGYAWIFPTGEGSANVGLGMRLDRYRGQEQDLKERLAAFLGLPHVHSRLTAGHRVRDVSVWTLPLGSRDMRRAYDGALLVGDAGAMIDPLTGGGIGNGLLAALMAADVVESALDAGDTSVARLGEFDRRCREAFRSDFRRAYLVQRVLLHFPAAMDWAVRMGARRGGLASAFIAKAQRSHTSRRSDGL